MHRPPARTALATACVAAVALLTSAQPPATAAEPRPGSRADRAGDQDVYRKALARTAVTRREARASDILSVRYSNDVREGVPSIRLDMRLRQVLPVSRRYQQRLSHYFDEENVVLITIGDPEADYTSTAGPRYRDVPPGCRHGDVEITGATVTTWMRIDCQQYDASDIGPVSDLVGRVRGKPGKQVPVSFDTLFDTVPVTWR